MHASCTVFSFFVSASSSSSSVFLLCLLNRRIICVFVVHQKLNCLSHQSRFAGGPLKQRFRYRDKITSHGSARQRTWWGDARPTNHKYTWSMITLSYSGHLCIFFFFLFSFLFGLFFWLRRYSKLLNKKRPLWLMYIHLSPEEKRTATDTQQHQQRSVDVCNNWDKTKQPCNCCVQWQFCTEVWFITVDCWGGVVKAGTTLVLCFDCFILLIFWKYFFQKYWQIVM